VPGAVSLLFLGSIVASWSDAHGLVSNPLAVLAEVDTILGKAGIPIGWNDTGKEGSIRVRVVITPSEPSGDGWHLSPSAMGVYLSEAEASTVFVFYHRVARVLGIASGREGLISPSDRKRLAKALGRVVVHELVHRIAPELTHARTGLMSEDLGSSFLTRRAVSLDEVSASAILSALRAAPRANALP
jgi:hypothetical protein